MNIYSKDFPYQAVLTERYRLNPSSTKETYHITLDLKGSHLDYKVGDCLGIFPKNGQKEVAAILDSLGATGQEAIFDPRKGDHLPLATYLIERANLTKVLKKLLLHVKQEGKEFPHIAALLAMLPRGTLRPEDLPQFLLPLLPRFYSIASAQSEVGEEAHLTVAVTGLCSSFLCHELSLGEPVAVYLQPTIHFTLTERMAQTPLIMIGPGTGIAPFRGFMQERMRKGHSMKNWLFFGERQRKCDFYYESFFTTLANQGCLKLETAFSRDQEEKVYVQHKMLEVSSTLYAWLQEGAYLFVCGDAEKMAKAVEKALISIFEKEKKCSFEEAKESIKNLKKELRYLQDVY